MDEGVVEGGENVRHTEHQLALPHLNTCTFVVTNRPKHRQKKITIKTPNPKCRHFLKIELYRDLAGGAEAPSPPRFLFGMVKQFCGFGISSNTQCITMILHMLSSLHTTRSPPPRHCLNKYPCTGTNNSHEGGEANQ